MRIVLASALLSAALPVGGHACTRTAFAPTLPANLVYFLGNARADTLPVNSVDRPIDPLGRPWLGEWRPPAFGQSARVQRLGGTLAPGAGERLGRALAMSDSIVVLVPWDITQGCGPAPWHGSVRWIRPHSQGLFRGQLRPPEAWVRGIPTLDVFHPTVEPYPTSPAGDSSRPSYPTRRERLTAAELFGLFQTLPTDSTLRRRPEDATQPLRRWADANPTLAARYPAADILRQARWAARHYRVRLMPLPLAGTYRFTVRLWDRQSFSFYARTEATPAATWDDARLASEANSLPWLAEASRPPTGYDAEIVVTRTEEELPRTSTEAERGQQLRFWFRISASPSRGRRGTQEWRGAVDFAPQALPVLATDSVSRARLGELAELAHQVSSLADPRALPATFRRLSNGRVEVSQLLRLRDGRLLTIRGVRVSDAAIVDS